MNQTHLDIRKEAVFYRTLQEYLPWAKRCSGGEIWGKLREDNLVFQTIIAAINIRVDIFFFLNQYKLITCAKQTKNSFVWPKHIRQVSRLAHIQAAVLTFHCWTSFFGTHSYLKLKLLNHLHLDSALCCISVIQSVLAAYVPETHNRELRNTLLRICLLSIKYSEKSAACSITEIAAVVSYKVFQWWPRVMVKKIN